MTKKYIPIACAFHDVLLDRATRRQPVEIIYQQLDGQDRQATAVIKDVFTKKGEEFILLDNAVQIRLDFLVSVDGEKLLDNNYC